MLAGSSVPSLCIVERLTLDGGLALGLVSDGVDVSIGGQALTAEFEMMWSLYPRLSTLDGCLSLTMDLRSRWVGRPHYTGWCDVELGPEVIPA